MYYLSSFAVLASRSSIEAYDSNSYFSVFFQVWLAWRRDTAERKARHRHYGMALREAQTALNRGERTAFDLSLNGMPIVLTMCSFPL